MGHGPWLLASLWRAAPSSAQETAGPHCDILLLSLVAAEAFGREAGGLLAALGHSGVLSELLMGHQQLVTDPRHSALHPGTRPEAVLAAWRAGLAVAFMKGSLIRGSQDALHHRDRALLL